MSLFQCMDQLNERLDYLLENEQSAWNLFVPWKKQFIQETTNEKSIILSLKSSLLARERTDNYEAFSTELALIDDYRRQTNKELPPYLQLIKDDLHKMGQMARKKPPSSHSATVHQHDAKHIKDAKAKLSVDESYRKFQKPPYLIAAIRQGKDHRLGLSRGECYGFTYAMVDPKLSPYKNPNVAPHFNRKIHEYQKFQMDRNQDQAHIKRKRLTREYFCPDPQVQAEEIYTFAQKNQGKELGLMRRASAGSHANYICMEPNGRIRFMDPNHGAYLFNTKEEFKEFYVAAAKIDKSQGVQFKFYNIDELQDDRHNQLKESITWGGKIRSLLTGNKYNDNAQVSIHVTGTAYALLGGGIGAGVGALLGSVVPIIGTIVGAVFGALLGATAGLALNWLAAKNGHMGLLGVPHYIRERWHSYTEKSSDTEPQIRQTNTIEQIKKIDSSSTAGMLRTMTPGVKLATELTPAYASSNEPSIDQKAFVSSEPPIALDAYEDTSETVTITPNISSS